MPYKKLENGLNVKQELFCKEYIKSGNATEAYKIAYGSKQTKRQLLSNNAYCLMQKPYIKNRIAELQKEYDKNCGIERKDVIKQLKAIMESNIRDYVNFDDLSEYQLKAIESIKEGANGIEIKLHGKSWAIERLCKMLAFDAVPDLINMQNIKIEVTDGLVINDK